MAVAVLGYDLIISSGSDDDNGNDCDDGSDEEGDGDHDGDDGSDDGNGTDDGDGDDDVFTGFAVAALSFIYHNNSTIFI